MFTKSRIMRILNGLQEEEAALLIFWDGKLPRVWLREWCGPYKLSVSIATAECVLREIRSGAITKPIRRCAAPWMRNNAIETTFVKGGILHV